MHKNLSKASLQPESQSEGTNTFALEATRRIHDPLAVLAIAQLKQGATDLGAHPFARFHQVATLALGAETKGFIHE